MRINPTTDEVIWKSFMICLIALDIFTIAYGVNKYIIGAGVYAIMFILCATAALFLHVWLLRR
jgi:hypothetical protein